MVRIEAGINVVARKRFTRMGQVLAHPISVAVLPFVTSLLTWFNFFIPRLGERWQVILITFGTVGVTISVCLPFVLRLFRYNVLMREVENALRHLPIRQESILLGAGGGSNKALGMILKAWERQHPNEHPPRSVCVSMRAQDDAVEFYPRLEELSPIMHSDVVIVLAQIGTGATAHHLTEWAAAIEAVHSVNVFSLIISPPAAHSGEWSGAYTLAIIERGSLRTSILPWVSTRDEF